MRRAVPELRAALNRPWGGLVWGAAVSLVVNAPVPLAQLYVTSPLAGDNTVLWFVIVLVFPLLAAILIFPCALVAAIFRRFRRTALTVALVALAYAVAGIGMLRVGHVVRMRAFDGLAARSTPLVSAVRTFRRTHERPPGKLNDLVPRYLPSIPGTGMGAYPEYEYVTGGEARKRYDGNAWVIIVKTPSGGINWDIFIYYPDQNYPEYGHGGRLRKIRDWAYVHE